MQIRRANLSIVLLAVALTATGCSGAHNRAPLTPPGSVASPHDEATDPFVGMWDHDPESGSTAELKLGMLMIDGPCIYVVSTPWDTDRWLSEDAGSEQPAIPLPQKRLLGLARSTLEFDAESNEITYSDSDMQSMSTGDYISYGGARRRAATSEETDLCGNTRMTLTPAIGRWILPDWLREQLSLPAVADIPLLPTASPPTPSADPLIAMWDSEPNSLIAPHIGMLMIDEPCVYIITGRWGSYRSESTNESWFTLPHKHLLGLPQQSTKFDAANDELWVNNNGPMKTGDYVTLGGGPSTPASSEEAAICDSTSKIEVTGIGPWKTPY